MKRKVKNADDDYAFREYGLTQKDLTGLEERVEQRYQRLKRTGKLITLTPAKLRMMIAECQRATKAKARR